MADAKSEILSIFLILCTWGFLVSLITYLKLNVQNSKRQIQYGGRKIENFISFADTLY